MKLRNIYVFTVFLIKLSSLQPQTFVCNELLLYVKELCEDTGIET